MRTEVAPGSCALPTPGNGNTSRPAPPLPQPAPPAAGPASPAPPFSGLSAPARGDSSPGSRSLGGAGLQLLWKPEKARIPKDRWASLSSRSGKGVGTLSRTVGFGSLGLLLSPWPQERWPGRATRTQRGVADFLQGETVTAAKDSASLTVLWKRE